MGYELVHEKEKFKAISDELDQTFAEMSAIKRERPAHTYLLHYYSIPPHPLLNFFLLKKIVWKFFPIDNCIATKIYSVFLLLKKFSYTSCDILQYFLKTIPSQTFTT